MMGKLARTGVLLGLMMVSFFFCCGFMGGCGGKPPQAVIDGRDLKSRAYQAASEGKSEVVSKVLEFYRDAEYRRIDLEIDAALQADFAKVRENAKATNGQVSVDLAIEGTRKLVSVREAERDSARRKVDKSIEDVKTIVKAADTNLAIANKLDIALQEFEDAGVDISAAQKAAEEIMALIPKK